MEEPSDIQENSRTYEIYGLGPSQERNIEHGASPKYNLMDVILDDLPTKVYANREELLDNVRSIAFLQGYVATIRKSKKDKYVIIGCDRGGVYRGTNIPIEQRKRKNASRLINCPFEIWGKMNLDGTWRIKFKNISHNHEPSNDLLAHPYARRFSEEEVRLIKEMTSAGALPRQIITSLRSRHSNLRAISRTLYNTKAKIIKESLGGRSKIHALLEEFGQGGFIYDIEHDENGHLTHLFFAHPSSIILMKTYSNIFIMDCTYKTNKYNMPLLDIIGVSSFNTPFYGCFVFMKNERKEDYVWALTNFSKLLRVGEPLVIVTNRESALMKAIEIVFPRTMNLLYVWHIEKSVMAYCKSHFEHANDWSTFLSEWTNLINSSTDSLFFEAWHHFEVQFGQYAWALNYLRHNWLPYKEYFVDAWTEKHLHFRNRVTSKAEGAHSVLKRYLQVSNGDFLAVKERICHAVENQFKEIKAQLSSELIRVPHRLCIPLFKELVNHVSIFALDELLKQYELVLSNSLPLLCSGRFSKTMGLPCAHRMSMMNSEVLELNDIHPQWKIDKTSLSFMEGFKGDQENLLQRLQIKYQQLPLHQKENVRGQISHYVNTSSPLILESVVPTREAKKTTSTKRDYSLFERVEKMRKCSICRDGGHDCRTCPNKVKDATSVLVFSNQDDGPSCTFSSQVDCPK